MKTIQYTLMNNLLTSDDFRIFYASASLASFTQTSHDQAMTQVGLGHKIKRLREYAIGLTFFLFPVSCHSSA